MKRFSTLTLVLLLALISSACGAQATPAPTLNPIDLQSTAAVVAFTMIAETQAAIPTATPIPPTETPTNTPLPTVTPIPVGSAVATLTPVPNGNAGGNDPCVNQPLTNALEGETVRLRINNTTDAALTVSIYLNQTATQNECGYRIYSVEAQQPLVINDLIEGCYTIWAWNPDPEGYFIVTNGSNCVDNSGSWVFEITRGNIRLRT